LDEQQRVIQKQLVNGLLKKTASTSHFTIIALNISALSRAESIFLKKNRFLEKSSSFP
jgi:hypothetical protein